MATNGRFEEDEFRDKIATVDEKGRRIWVYPKKQFGKYFTRRSIVAYSLLILLFAGPFLKIGGEPLLMINIIERKFVIFGQVFWPADIFIFAIGMIAFIILIIVFTVLNRILLSSISAPEAGSVIQMQMGMPSNRFHGNGFQKNRVSYRW